MARAVKFHEVVNSLGWPMFTANQTDIRFALCKKALCPDRTLILKLKDCYQSEAQEQSFCKLKFLSEEYFTANLSKIEGLAWGGVHMNCKLALEGGFYPFVRYMNRCRPVDTGCIWIGTRHEYPRIYVNNRVANWICPYSRTGHVMTEPFEPLYRVIENWSKLANKKRYPDLDLPPLIDF